MTAAIRTRPVIILLVVCVAARAAERPKKLFYEGATFPSAKCAPVNPPYFMLWYGGMSRDPASDDGVYRNTAVEYFDMNNIETWAQKSPSTLRLTWRRAYHKDSEPISAYNPDPSKYYEYYNIVDKSCLQGIDIDEYSNAGENPAKALKAIPHVRRVQQESPPFFIAGWTPGNLKQWLADEHDAFDIIIVEVYMAEEGTCWHGTKASDMQKQIDQINSFGLGEKSAIGLSVGDRKSSSCPPPSPAFFEAQIKYLREHLPQAQLSFYRAGSSDYLANYKAVIDKYFFDPAPSAAIQSPADGATVGGTVKVEMKGTPNAATGEAIAHYRLFVDNQCVYVGDAASYSWDANDWDEGTHTLTVHAVDADWLVGVAQIEVDVKYDATVAWRPPAIARGVLSPATETKIYDFKGRPVGRSSRNRGGTIDLLPGGVYLVRQSGRQGARAGSLVRIP